MGRLSLGVLILLVVGCTPTPSGTTSQPSPKTNPKRTNTSDNFHLTRGMSTGELNAWRQENVDKHIVSFLDAGDCWIIYFVDNPGNSRQTFVNVKRDRVNYPDAVLDAQRIKQKFYGQEIVCIGWHGDIQSWIVLLQDKFEPYEPSQE